MDLTALIETPQQIAKNGTMTEHRTPLHDHVVLNSIGDINDAVAGFRKLVMLQPSQSLHALRLSPFGFERIAQNFCATMHLTTY